MEKLGSYILSVVSAAVLLGILYGFQDEKTATGKIFRLMGGLFLAFTIIQPISRLDFSHITAFAEGFSADAQEAAAYGEAISDEQVRAIIKDRTEAYILDKATLYQLDVQVEVTLSADQPPVPISVVIEGSFSPFAKTQMQQIIQTDLGISKENQTWIR